MAKCSADLLIKLGMSEVDGLGVGVCNSGIQSGIYILLNYYY